MGKRKKPSVDSKARQAFQYKMIQYRKPPFTCPHCFKRSVYYKKDDECIMIYCNEERKGEVFPLIPGKELLDYYCIFCDAWFARYQDVEDEPPTWKFKSLTRKKFESLVKRVTYGTIIVQETVND